MNVSNDNHVPDGTGERKTGRFYCCLAGVVVGPLRSRDVARLARKGVLRADDGVREGAAGKWYPAGRVEGAQFPPATADERPDDFYWFLDGSTLGPFSNRELRLLATSGRLERGNYVRKGGRRWRSVENLPEICRLIGTAEPPAAARPDAQSARINASACEPADPQADRQMLPSVPAPAIVADAVRQPDRRAWSHWLFMAMLLIPFLIPPAGPELDVRGIAAASLLGLIACTAVSYELIRPSEIRPTVCAVILGSGMVSVAGLLKLQEFWTMDGEIPPDPFPPDAVMPLAVTGLSSRPLQSLGRTIFSALVEVGLVEECVKLLPVVASSWTVLRSGSVARVAFLACLSGLSFGVCEGLVRSYDALAEGSIQLSESVVRFVSAPLGHALFCWLSVLLTCRFIAAGPGQRARSGRLICALLLAVLCSGFVHGLYDLLLGLQMASAAGVVMLTTLLGTLEIWSRRPACD